MVSTTSPRTVWNDLFSCPKFPCLCTSIQIFCPPDSAWQGIFVKTWNLSDCPHGSDHIDWPSRLRFFWLISTLSFCLENKPSMREDSNQPRRPWKSQTLIFGVFCEPKSKLYFLNKFVHVYYKFTLDPWHHLYSENIQ